ncbi:MAG: tRNA (guanosine(37)-N1)-methyltransferase TrmD [Epulopiscium sp.]|nr:tRNA (guanosine(37)-N1)-methyltransferase TrmD [Candidatus Epulonipiscium sp.]
MKFYILTLFPEMIQSTLNHSILGRAQEKQTIEIECINIRDYAQNKHGQVDDYPYGGGPGMVMQAPPIYRAYESIIERTVRSPKVLYMSPQGEQFNQKMAHSLSKEEELIFLCGHYEGVDERLINTIVTHEISIGDFILTGGELAAMSMIDSIARLIPGVLGKAESFQQESFSDSLLEYPQYTRPAVFLNQPVPEILLSGHHEKIATWRREQSLLRTLQRRPDLLESAQLSQKDKFYLKKHSK